MLTKDIIKAFDLKEGGKQLEGGQNTSMQYGNLVIKPIDDENYYEHTTTLFNALKPIGYRISKSKKSSDDTYVYKGYAATYYEAGHNDDDRIEDKLKISYLLHRDLRQLKITSLPDTHDPWTKAQNVLWRHHLLPQSWDQKKYKFCQNILDQLPDVNEAHQLIHSDLGGNVLFHDTLEPLIIDFSPTIAPKSYADAIIVCDSIAWAKAPLSSVELLKPLKYYKPFIKYAIAFRVLTIAFCVNAYYDRLQSEWDNYYPIWQYINNMEV